MRDIALFCEFRIGTWSIVGHLQVFCDQFIQIFCLCSYMLIHIFLKLIMFFSSQSLIKQCLMRFNKIRNLISTCGDQSERPSINIRFFKIFPARSYLIRIQSIKQILFHSPRSSQSTESLFSLIIRESISRFLDR